MECTGGPKLGGGAKADYTQHKHTLRRAEPQKLQRFLWLHSSPLNRGPLAQVLHSGHGWMSELPTGAQILHPPLP